MEVLNSAAKCEIFLRALCTWLLGQWLGCARWLVQVRVEGNGYPEILWIGVRNPFSLLWERVEAWFGLDAPEDRSWDANWDLARLNYLIRRKISKISCKPEK